MYDLPKPVLNQLLILRNTHPERLSEHETAIAARICVCTECDWVWVRRKNKVPERCPRCHIRAWDRPLITALLEAHKRAAPPAATPKTQSEGGSTCPPSPNSKNG